MSNPPPPPSLGTAEPSRFKRALLSAVAVLIVYGNLAVAFDLHKIGFPALPQLPTTFALRDAFLITGMFTGYSTTNFDPFIEGQRDHAGHAEDRGSFVALDVKEHFPLRAAITYTQFFAAHHWDMLGTSAQRGVWAQYGKQIKARHNRLHPERRIARLRFGAITFPQSEHGYRGAKHHGSTVRYLWYAEP